MDSWHRCPTDTLLNVGSRAASMIRIDFTVVRNHGYPLDDDDSSSVSCGEVKGEWREEGMADSLYPLMAAQRAHARAAQMTVNDTWTRNSSRSRFDHVVRLRN